MKKRKELKIVYPSDCPYHDGTWDECAYVNGPEFCVGHIPEKCPLREGGLLITVEE